MANFRFITSIYRTLIITLIFTSVLSLFENKSLISIGRQSIDVLLIISLLFVIYCLFTERLDTPYLYQIAILFALLSISYAYSFFLYSPVTTFHPIIELLLFFVFISSLILMKWDVKDLSIISVIIVLIVLVFFYNWTLSGYTTFKFESLFRSPNAMGAILMVFSYFLILKAIYSNHIVRILNISLLLLTLFLIYCTSSRTVWLSLCIIFLSWVVYLVAKNKFKYLFPIAIIINFLFTIFYVLTYNTPIGNWINNLSNSLFGKSFYSGREEIWNDLFDRALDALFFGYGYGTHFNDMNSRGQSPHNMYLQITLESGIVGLLIFILILYIMWKMLLNNIETKAAKLSAFYLIAFIFYLSYETTIFPTTIVAIGIFQWIVITFGLNFKEKNHPERLTLY